MLTFDSEDERLKFESLYLNYRNLLFKCAFNILKRKNLAEDATSEAFIRIYTTYFLMNLKIR